MTPKFHDQIRLASFRLAPAKVSATGSRTCPPFATLALVHAGRRIEPFVDFLAGVGSSLLSIALWTNVAGGADPAADPPTWSGFGRLGRLGMTPPKRDQDHPIGTVPLEVPAEDVASLLDLARAWLELVNADDLEATISLELRQPSLLEEAFDANPPRSGKPRLAGK